MAFPDSFHTRQAFSVNPAQPTVPNRSWVVRTGGEGYETSGVAGCGAGLTTTTPDLGGTLIRVAASEELILGRNIRRLVEISEGAWKPDLTAPGRFLSAADRATLSTRQELMMAMNDATERPRTQTDWVEQQLRRSLLAGEFAPDERLSPKDLSLRWNVSSTPLREAMNRLGTEGLLKIVPQKGVRVAPISIDEMFQIYEVRLLIEPVALQRSVERGTGQWLERVEDAWKRFRPLHESPSLDILDYEQAHEEFHTALLSACGSDWTIRTISSMARQSSRFRLLTNRGGPEDVADEHLDIFEAARDGRAGDAAALHTEHLLHTMESSDPASGLRLREQFDSDCDAVAKRLGTRRSNRPT